ncbi:MAG: sugar phosphate isomerase/epimerase, partial [Spirochaetaceae bacterium]|nr:sugar phosphate isomerase/epimerase [Spirochaetaceae bacterium]
MKTVLHSISYAGLWRGQARLSLEDFINHAADLGFDGVELTCKRPHAGLLEMTGEARKSVRKVLKDRNLACASLAAYTDFCAGLNGSFIPINEMQLIYIKELVHLAREWECDLIRIFTGYENKPVPYFTQWDACVSAVRECCLLAAPWGIRIGIQNHHDIALDADSLHSFIDEVG